MTATRLPLTIVGSTMLALASAGPISAQHPAGYGVARLVDIERDGTIKGACSKKDECEADTFTYLSVWLFGP